MNVTPNNRPLSALEAAMLAIYMLGHRFVYKDCARFGYITAAPSLDFKHSWQPFFNIREPELGQIMEIGNSETFELLPWLTARGIVPPEVAK